MFKKWVVFFIALIFVVSAGGCVWKSEFKKKETEVNNLKADKERLIQERDRLIQEKDTLDQAIAKLGKEMSVRDKDNTQLKAEKDRLIRDVARIDSELKLLSQNYDKDSKAWKDELSAAKAAAAKKIKKVSKRVLK